MTLACLKQFILPLVVIALVCATAQDSPANEPVVGGPCEGCENVFVGIAFCACRDAHSVITLRPDGIGRVKILP